MARWELAGSAGAVAFGLSWALAGLAAVPIAILAGSAAAAGAGTPGG